MEALLYSFLFLAGVAVATSLAIGFIVIRRWDEWIKL